MSREVKRFFWLGKKGDSAAGENGFCNSRGEKAGHEEVRLLITRGRAFQRLEEMTAELNS